MAFRDLEEFLVPDEPLLLPVRGKEYRFSGEISAQSWLRLQQITDQTRAAIETSLEDGEEPVPRAEQLALERELFGSVEAEMIADGCTGNQVRVVLATATVFYLSGREAAEAFWDRQGEARAPSREERRHPATRSTRPRGSAAGTSSRKKSAG